MKSCPALPALLALVSLLPACLENEERIEVAPDGSVEVHLRSEGDAGDLVDGFPIPLEAPWTLSSPDARRWFRELDPAAGAEAARRRLQQLDWPAATEDGRRKARLEVTGAFASVSELPEWFAPRRDEYRTAHLRRTTSLQVRELDGKRVYVFERVFHGFDAQRLDLMARLEVPEAIQTKFEEHLPLTGAEREDLIRRVRSTYVAVAHDFAADALLGLYVEGRAELPVERLQAILEAVNQAVHSTVTAGRIAAVLAAAERDEEGTGPLLERLESDWREALRGALGAAVAETALSEPTRNAIRYALEWQFAAFDHYGDLGDETFLVRLALPGVLVGGNYRDIENGAARWRFSGQELRGRDVVLRAVAVLEDPRAR